MLGVALGLPRRLDRALPFCDYFQLVSLRIKHKLLVGVTSFDLESLSKIVEELLGGILNPYLLQLLGNQLLNQLLRFHHLALQSIHVFEQIALGKQLTQQKLCIGLILIQHVFDELCIIHHFLLQLLDLPGLGPQELGGVLLLAEQLFELLINFFLLGGEFISNFFLNDLKLLPQDRPLVLEKRMKALLHFCLALDFVGLDFVDLDLLQLLNGEILQLEDLLVAMFSVLPKQDTVRANHLFVGETNQVSILVVLQTEVHPDEISDSDCVFLARVVSRHLLLDGILQLFLFSKLDEFVEGEVDGETIEVLFRVVELELLVVLWTKYLVFALDVLLYAARTERVSAIAKEPRQF